MPIEVCLIDYTDSIKKIKLTPSTSEDHSHTEINYIQPFPGQLMTLTDCATVGEQYFSSGCFIGSIVNFFLLVHIMVHIIYLHHF